jgi:adenylate kinase
MFHLRCRVTPIHRKHNANRGIGVFNVCPRCGQYSVEKSVSEDGPFVICPYCGHQHPFLRLPLFVITGASGAGKTTIGFALVQELHGEAVVMESDILWRPEFATAEDDYRSYRNLWLRVAKNISQAGLPVVLVGTSIPEQFEHLPERRYFSAIHYLGLIAGEEELVRRLRDRPAWRNSRSDEFVERMRHFNCWLHENAAHTNPPIELINTSELGVSQGVQHAASWVREHLR